MKLLYFAWLRARIGHAEEDLALPPEVRDVESLLRWLQARGGCYAEAPLTFPIAAGFAWKKRPGRREYLRCTLARENGAVVARRYPKDGAGILSSIVRSDGFAILDEALADIAPGTLIEFLPFSEVFA